MMDFIAIDFETATDRRNSACSVAVVEVRDGKVARTYSTLIRPPGLRFSSFNISIHGITPEMVAHERDFAGVWSELRPFLEGRVVVAHNAPFDMGVLRSSLLANHIEPPNFYHSCTVQISRKAWPHLPNHKLNTVGDFLHVDFRHHDALEDARACAAIPLAAAEQIGADSVEELAQALRVPVKPFDCTPKYPRRFDTPRG
ncbi:MAG: 3'-5' exonuclease [Schwartzia sp.]|nr:3'-5' exonuclease [Schwartzia sp. (in: firmicutes)]